MITKTSYDMPYPSIVPTTMDEVKDYLDDIADWLAEALGLVVREDLTVEAPSYAEYSYVKFLAESASDDPYLAVFNPNIANGVRWSVYCVAPTKKVSNDFMPIIVPTNVSSFANYPNRANGAMVVNYSGLGATFKHSIVIADDATNERKFAWIRSYQISTGNIFSKGNESLIYFGNIRMEGNLEKTCVMIADGANSAWMEKYEQCACSTALGAFPYLNANNYSGMSGIMYANNLGKEYLVEADYCIGEDAYIPNTLQYSDCGRQLYDGTIFTINNKRYISLHVHSTTGAAILITPEEVD